MIVFDGLPENVRDGTSVLEFLSERNEPTSHVIVEINGSFVHPKDYSAKRLKPNDRVEVVYPAFGG